jgi:hypothetical protein
VVLPRRGLTDLIPNGAERPHELSPDSANCPASPKGIVNMASEVIEGESQLRWPRWFRVA